MKTILLNIFLEHFEFGGKIWVSESMVFVPLKKRLLYFQKNNQRFELKFKKTLQKKRPAASRPIFQKINQKFQKKNPALRAEIQKKQR